MEQLPISHVHAKSYMVPEDLLASTIKTGTILDRIVEKKAFRLQQQMRCKPLSDIIKEALAAPACPNFLSSVRKEGLSIIAEIKKASPSRGIIAETFDPAAQGKSYASADVAAISVLTEQDFFLGRDLDLQLVRENVNVPILRKDFTIHAYQIYEAKTLGASAVLLIAAILDDEKIATFLSLAEKLGLDAILEIHTFDELMRALSLGAPIIGINNRDLKTFYVDLSTTERLAPMIPSGKTIIAESGIHTAADLSRCYRSGVHAVLIGESLMRASQPDGEGVAAKLDELCSHLPKNDITTR